MSELQNEARVNAYAALALDRLSKVEMLLSALERIAGDHPVGSQCLLDYYHRTEDCELPDNCEHCLAVRQARHAIKFAKAEAKFNS